MQHADSTARKDRPSKEAILRALEKITEDAQSRSEQTRRAPRASGFYTVVVDEFAGIERLDREELDEDG